MDHGQARPAPDPRRDADRQDPRRADERDVRADGREADLDAREARTAADESARGARRRRHQDIAQNAAARDEQADARDSSAERRDRDASLAGFLNDDNYGDGLRSRRSAALDRLQSKEDRTSAASDRSEMADLEGPEDGEPGKPT
jgi:hypothetical protein